MASDPAVSRYEAFLPHIRLYLSSRDKAHLQAAFRLLDLDGDGFISKAEMIAFFRAFGAEREGARTRMMELFREADMNKDGVLDPREFERVAKKLNVGGRVGKPSPVQSPNREQEIQRLLAQYTESDDPALLEGLFNLLDADANGSISQAELQASHLLKEATDKPTAASMLLGLGDLDGDGVLNMEEFVQLVHR